MKTIGFVDYYIDEWHANNYPAWIKSLSEKYGLEYEVRYAWAELNEAPVDGKRPMNGVMKMALKSAIQ